MMIGNQVRDTLRQVYSNPAAAGAKRTQGDAYAATEGHKEVDVFHSVAHSDTDRDGKVSQSGPGHYLSVPWSRNAEFSGCVQTGQMARVDGLFITSTEKPTFETYIETSFTPEGIVKREATFGGKEITARTVSINHNDPSLNYTEEFRIAR